MAPVGDAEITGQKLVELFHSLDEDRGENRAISSLYIVPLYPPSPVACLKARV